MICTSCGAACIACAQKRHADEKAAFLKRYKAALVTVAKRLDLGRGEYAVSVNPGGVAVMGDVYLQTTKRERGLYVCVPGYRLVDDPPRLFYRSTRDVDGRTEHGPNLWLPISELDGDATSAVEAFRAVLDAQGGGGP